MKNKKMILALSVLGCAIVAALFYLKSHPSNEVIQDLPPELPNPMATSNSSAENEPSNRKSKTGASEIPATDFSGASNGFLPTKMEDPKLFEFLQKSFKDMSVCLNMKVGNFAANEDMNMEKLIPLVSPDLGDVITTIEEWTTTDIKTSSGEIRRIFVQTSENNLGETIRHLKYTSITTGGQKEIPLTKEQSVNPSETILASLESDGQLLSKAAAHKVYFQSGDDLSIVEKDARLYSFELAHDQKTFKCSGLDSSKNMSCTCH